MPNINSKSQYAKNKWDGAEEPTINNLYTSLNMILKVRIDRIQRDSYGPPADTHAKWKR